MSSNHRPKREMRFGPLLILGNLIFAIGVALFVSTADNLSVRGGGFSVYAGPISNSDPQIDAEGNPVEGRSYILVTSTPEADESNGGVVSNEQESESGETLPESTDDAQSGETSDDSADLTVATATPVREICLKPTGWFYYLVPPGQTLGKIAAQTGYTIDSIQSANCLTTDQINYGTTLYVPVNLSAEQGGGSESPTGVENTTPIPPTCNNAPAGWIPYLVKPKDNVFRMALNSSVSVADIVVANCLLSASHVVAGQIVFLPPDAAQVADGGFQLEPTPVVEVPTNTPEPPTNTPEPTNTTEPTATSTEIIRPTDVTAGTPGAAETATQTSTPVVVFTATPLPTNTSVPIFTNTPAPTETASPTAESSPTSTATPTEPVVAPTETPSETETPVATETAIPTETATQEATATTEATATATETSVPTVIPTETATVVPTSTETSVPTPVPTETATLPPTPTETAVPTATETAVPTATATETIVPTATETLVPTPSPTDDDADPGG